MACNLLPVKVDAAPVAHGTEIEELPFARNRRCVKMTGIPHRALIIFEFRSLGIPVAGDIQTESAFEGIFIKFFL